MFWILKFFIIILSLTLYSQFKQNKSTQWIHIWKYDAYFFKCDYIKGHFFSLHFLKIINILFLIWESGSKKLEDVITANYLCPFSSSCPINFFQIIWRQFFNYRDKHLGFPQSVLHVYNHIIARHQCPLHYQCKM